jgi:2-polyprenyl-3-methyl-5-hydroxy-6-metoxy-1,4-benzoquinol methylase
MGETVERVVPGELSWEEFGLEHQQRYEYFQSYYSGKKVLDAACGSGYGSFHIANSGASSVLGIDISGESVTRAQKIYKNNNLEYKIQDCSDLRVLKSTFDVIVSFETLEHLTDPRLFIKSAAESLNPGGIFICSTPNKMRLSGAGYINQYHLNELNYEDFYEAMSDNFEVQTCLHQTETLPYLRYMELKYLIGTQENRLTWYFFQRVENMIRKLIGRTFKKEPFMNPYLGFQYEGDMEIKALNKHENWHKTFIIVGRKKSK